MYLRTASLYVDDHRGAQVFHAYQVSYGPEWHYSTPGFSGVLIASNEADLARAIALAVYGLEMGWALHSQWYIEGENGGRPHSQVCDCYPDPMGGVVMDQEYLCWGEWIRRAIPKTRTLQVDPEPGAGVQS